MSEKPWYQDEASLLHELKSLPTANRVPVLPGYDQLTEIARGGQGTVFRAVQLSTHREVAIKVLFEGPVDVLRNRVRFEREIELAARLEHPNIVRIYGGGATDDGRLYVVMELVDGIPWDRFVNPVDVPSPSIDQGLVAFRKICDAVQHAHRRGVIHRDLKPSNILVTTDGEPHVLDFGIARSITSEDAASTKTGEFVGTLAFTSPEQLSGGPEAVDTRSDVYSLGVMLYRMLADQPPYDTDAPLVEVIEAIRTEVPVAPSRVSDRSDVELDAVVAKALAKDPDQRYASASALGDDLGHYLAGEAIEARGDRMAYVLWKTVLRHRLKFAAATLVLGALVLFSVTTTSLWRSAVRAQAKTNEIKVFWEDTLGSISGGENRTVSFSEVLDEAAQWVEITTEGEPEIEASLRLTIGNGYRCLGQFEAAEAQLTQAIAIRKSLFGENHVDVVQAVNALAILREGEGNYSEAERMFRAGLVSRRSLLGDHHPDVAQSLQNLGRLMLVTGDLEAAEKCFAEALQIRKRHFAAEDPAIATVLFNQADLAGLRLDWNEAARLHEAALHIRQSRLAETHPDRARSMIALAKAELHNGQREKAMQLAQAALELHRETLPPGHPLIEEAAQMLDQDGAP